MEDYTYNLSKKGKEGILEAHICWRFCPSRRWSDQHQGNIHFLWETEKILQDLYLHQKTGPAIATSLIDLGNRFRLIINDVECKKTEKPMPKTSGSNNQHSGLRNRIWLTGAEAWILAGGAHHTAFTL